MSKRSFVTLAIFAVGLAVAIPLWASGKEGSLDASPEKVAASDQQAKEVFATNCGSCHTLARAGTDGVVGPNLDELLGAGTPEGNEPRVLTAIENGVSGRMPAGILQGDAAKQVANFVAREAGQ